MKKIGVSNLVDVRIEGISNKGVDFNIMIIGSHGIGKSTFLNRLLGVNVLKYQPFAEKIPNKYWYLDDICNIQISNLEIKESNFSMRMVIAEIDGMGDHCNNTNCSEPVVEILENAFIEYDKKVEENVKSIVRDKRFHLCFYMLEPLESIKIAELEVMKAINKYCNLIPIIGKSDLLNSKNIKELKASIKEQLDDHGIYVFEDSVNGFEVPFFVISGNAYDISSVKEDREYTWGNYKIEESSFNEFLKLKKFIFEHSVIALKEETEILYNNFRTTKLAEHFVGDSRNANNKNFFAKFDDFKKEIKEIKNRIKQKKLDLEID